MNVWVSVLQFFLGLGVSVFLFWPLIKSTAGYSTRPSTSSESEYEIPESFVQVMSDLEYDYETGKLSRSDYERLREEVFRESGADVEVSDSDTTEESGDDSLEDAVSRARDRLDF